MTISSSHSGAAPVKSSSGRKPPAAIPARKVPCPLVSVDGTRASDHRIPGPVDLFPGILCAIGRSAGIIPVGYARRNQGFILRQALIPDAVDPGGPVRIPEQGIV